MIRASNIFCYAGTAPNGVKYWNKSPENDRMVIRFNMPRKTSHPVFPI